MTCSNDLMNHPVDVSRECCSLESNYFLADLLREFDPATGRGRLQWTRHRRKSRLAFSQVALPFERSAAWEFPPVYVNDPEWAMQVSFYGERVIRLRWSSRPAMAEEAASPMLVDLPADASAWTLGGDDERMVKWASPTGSVIIHKQPFRVELRDSVGRLLTRSQHYGDTFCLQNTDPLPFSVVRRASDLGRQFAATFSLSPGERIYGAGESFTRLDKRGQKLVLWTQDAHGVQNSAFYKPVPFFLSNRGYGMFVHSSAPMTFDFGHDYDAATTLHVGDDELDLFVFLGEPAEILESYTGLTGRSPRPPLWSFGLWMSRITYKSEEEAREVAARLRAERIPCDVIHLDTGWFEKDWCCDYAFSGTRFADAAKMIADLREAGFRISLWQLPYFTPENPLYHDAVKNGYVVRDARGGAATEDAIIDFSNPDAVNWYQALLRRLLELGVAAIKADFGESGPADGLYASGRTGWYEHNLYPLRYNRAVGEVTREVTGDCILWGRSAWAGSQRYPLHWGGDAENTDCGMAATLRGGLSLGLSGFSYWSHDIGGFVKPTPEELYLRWLPFGLLTSHSRCHGVPPKEPWHFGEAFTGRFRAVVELKYRLMPYIYNEATECSARGWPMIRPLFFEFPRDPGSWVIEDAYLLGRDILVAPLLENAESRLVYLPSGCEWVDYQTGEVRGGGAWHTISGGALRCVLLVRHGAAIPHVESAPSTDRLDWSRIHLQVFARSGETATGRITLPGAADTLGFQLSAGSRSMQVIGSEEARGRAAAIAFTTIERVVLALSVDE